MIINRNVINKCKAMLHEAIAESSIEKLQKAEKYKAAIIAAMHQK